jgi:glycosyltransferase involved in cell wall biosynthesis
MRRKPRVAIIRGPLLNPFEMQSYEPLRNEFDITAFKPHITQFETGSMGLAKQTLWCPIAGQIPFERGRRQWQAARDLIQGDTFSFCGMRDQLKGFDLYHLKDQSFCYSFEAALARRRYGGKLVVTQLENIPFLNEEKFMERHIKKTVRENADLFLAASEGARQTLLQEGVPDFKIRRISNSIDTDHFTPGSRDSRLASSLGIPSGAFTLMYVGRLAGSKGTFGLLEAFRRMYQSDSKLHLLLVGKDEEGVEEWVKRYHLDSRIHLTGFVSYKEMPRYYRLADLVILPSLTRKRWKEQFGYVLAEAMACGIPTMGSDSGAIPEVIGREEMIFKEGSVESIRKILEIQRHRPLGSVKKWVRKRSVELFSSKRLTEFLRKTYNELLCETSGTHPPAPFRTF